MIKPKGQKATLGLVVLSEDETIEIEMRRLLSDPNTALHISRIRSGEDLNAETIAAMQDQLTQSASMFPKAAQFDCVGYACTSATSKLGADTIDKLIKNGCRTQFVTNPLTALIAACQALSIRKLAVVSPYIDEVPQSLCDALNQAGIDTPSRINFDIEKEADVVRIEPEIIWENACSIGNNDDCQAVFLSCTNLRTIDLIGPLEAELNRPILTSNQVLAWHMAQSAKTPISRKNFGRIYRIQSP